MGITVGPYTTDEGFVLSAMYLSVDSFRLVKTLSRDVLGCTFTVSAYQSRDSFRGGASSIKIPQHLANCEMFIRPNDFYSQTIYGLAYQRIKEVWESQGYTITDVHEPQQPSPTTYIYDASGYNFAGFNVNGLDLEGYNAQGFDSEGYNRQGYNVQGFNAQGFNAQGFGPDGFNAQGLDYFGFNRDGIDKDGYNRQGYDAEGYNRQGFNAEGYDREGYDRQGYNSEGYDRLGYNAQGINANGQSQNSNSNV